MASSKAILNPVFFSLKDILGEAEEPIVNYILNQYTSDVGQINKL